MAGTKEGMIYSATYSGVSSRLFLYLSLLASFLLPLVFDFFAIK